MVQSPYRPYQQSPRRRGSSSGPPSKMPIQRSQPVILRREIPEWQKRPNLSIQIRGLNSATTTYDIYRNFKVYGEIIYIELFINRVTGVRDGSGRIKFSPPPTKDFWTTGRHVLRTANGAEEYNVRLELVRPRDNWKMQSPVKKTEFYDPLIKLKVSAVHFGLMVNPHSVMPMYTARPTTMDNGAINRDEVTLAVDLERRTIEISFQVAFEDPRMEGATDYNSSSAVGELSRVNKYKFWIPFDQLQQIKRLNLQNGGFALVISLDSPPQFFRKREDDESCHSAENSLWSDSDSWFRQTDVVYDPYRLGTTIVALHKQQPVIDIGRWTTYVLTFHGDQQQQDHLYPQMKKALQDFNIRIIEIDRLDSTPPRPAGLWSLIDPSQHSAVELLTLDGQQGSVPLPFEVRYQLEVCISQEILNEDNIDRDFITTLASIASKDSTRARNILEYVSAQEKRIFDPMSVFEDEEALAFSPKSDIPHYCSYTRKATVTPSTIYFTTPTVETTNRIIRHYARENREGRFLRVQFTDEKFEGRINSCADKQRNDELFTRVYRTLFNGIRIGDRHYKLLAFGNSQFRENGAYFFCETEHLTCDDIRHWMGNFTHIKEVARYAARLGQCFSTTRAIHGLSNPEIIKIPDINSGEYCFTDGVGKISSFLAQMITAELGLRVVAVPSVFQFRLGGCKGVLTVWPEAKDREVHIRPSQQKFAATYNGLEIIRWSRFSACSLNRQTITILSSLGVDDRVFLHMLTEQLADYETAMNDNDVAISLLSRYIDDNQMTINIASMINNGFMTERDPFVRSLLHLWRSWSIKLLKEKAKIIVENGAFLLGCVDETATLRGYTKSKTTLEATPLTEEELPQIFVQVPSKQDPNQYNVIEGVCLVGRNPSLHPGDIRVVQAVNVPALQHLRDVVVFPQTGDRDVQGMCSGGDLDGDDFFVIWDKQLMPPETNCEPMNYAAPPRKLQKSVTTQDLMKFFVRFMKNDALPTIAHAHLAQSDLLPKGIKDPKCLELAALHSKAVDYVKTGQPAEMPRRLSPMSWPHFMEKRNKKGSYHSNKILGQLYDRVERVDFVPQWQEPFDKRILRAYQLDNATLKNARQVKSEYDTAMRRIMAQQEIGTEFEVWSTFILTRPRVGSGYKIQETMGVITDGLKEQYRAACIERAGGKDFSVLGPFVAAMYKVTKEEVDIALAECRTIVSRGGREVPKRLMEQKSMPLISFPWLFEKELGRIATGQEADDDLTGLGLLPLVLKGGQSRKRTGGGDQIVDDFVQQEDGVIVHRGEELDLFRPDVDSEDLSGESDFDEAIREDAEYVVGENGEVVLNTVFRRTRAPAHLLSGTGVEDVVPRTELDGFVDPRQAARLAHDLQQTSETRRGSAHSPSSLVDMEVPEILIPVLPAERSPSAAAQSPIINTPTADESGDADEDLLRDEGREVEEEEIVLDMQEESSLEKMNRMMGM